MKPTTVSRIQPRAAYTIAAVVLLCFFSVIAWERGGNLLPLLSCVLLPLLPSLAMVVPGVLLYSIAVDSSIGFGAPTSTPSVVIALLAMAIIACICRVSVSTVGQHPTMAAAFFQAPSRSRRTLNVVGIQQLGTLLLIALALGLSTFLCRPFTRGLAAPPPSVGLIREAYFGIKLALSLALIVWVVRSGLDYLHANLTDPHAAAIRLHGELWQWNGREQRMVSRESGKNARVAGDSHQSDRHTAGETR